MNKTNSIYEDNADFYPKVFVPQFIKAIKNQQFTFKEIYPEYNIPESPYLLEDKEDPFVYLKSFLGCGFFAYIGLSLFLLILGMMFFSDHEADYFSVIRPLIYGSTLLIAILSTVTAYRDIKKKTKIACNNYNQELIEYKKKKEEFSKLNAHINTHDFIHKEKLKRLVRKLETVKKDILKSSQILEDYKIKKGPSEELFHDFMKEYSDFEIYKSLKFGYYYPDLVLIKKNLVVDLEIDEPYTFDTKEPIHYDHIDDSRDRFFQDNNFLVIHLTEEQVLKEPEYCLDVINEIVESCLNLRDIQKSQRFSAFETPVWTYEMAFNYAYNNTRKNTGNLITEIRKNYL